MPSLPRRRVDRMRSVRSQAQPDAGSSLLTEIAHELPRPTRYGRHARQGDAARYRGQGGLRGLRAAVLLSEVLHIRQAEVRLFLHGQLPPGRTEELHAQLLAAGIPLSDDVSAPHSMVINA